LEEQIEKKYSPMTETTYYTLLSVKEPRHGYAIMSFVNELTNSRIRMGTGTLYTMLGRLLEDNLVSITSQDNGKKTYQITQIGEKCMEIELERLSKQLEHGKLILRKEEE
jgi:DNA-binding PadR family transcriptional regulator